MKLLLDENLSDRLIGLLQDVFPSSCHALTIGTPPISDRMVWEYARSRELTIDTKDSDYQQIAILRGYPPKIIWIRRGNCSTRQIESLLRSNVERIRAFFDDKDAGTLILS